MDKRVRVKILIFETVILMSTGLEIEKIFLLTGIEPVVRNLR